MSGVRRATIGNVVQSLLDDGLIEEVTLSKPSEGQDEPVGRPVWFSSSAGMCAVVTMSSGEITAALVNAVGDTLTTDTRKVRPTASAATIVESMALGLARVMSAQSGILGVGVTVPGVCDPDEGVVIRSVNAPGLNGFALRPALAEHFELPCYLDNRSRTQALAERLFGAGRGLERFACIDTWEGLGVGLWFEGAVGGGGAGAAGEIGHTCVAVDGEVCECGLRGCWETTASTSWLRREALRLGLEVAADLSAGDVVAGAARGSAAHKELLDRYVENLAVGFANIAQVFTPQALIVNGDVLSGGEVLRAGLERQTAARCLPHISESIRVVFSELGSKGPVLGAAGLVLAHAYRTST